jgi:hypothetical protein
MPELHSDRVCSAYFKVNKFPENGTPGKALGEEIFSEG